MRRLEAGLLAALGIAIVTPAAAQEVVAEEEDVPAEAAVERGYVPGEGRGIQYGAHVLSPIYPMPMDRAAAGESLGPGPGAGLHGRVGWEFPSGFTLELHGGFAFNALEAVAGEPPDRSHVLSQADAGLGLRYMFFNETAIVPFVQVGAGGRWFWLEWPGGDQVDAVGAFALTGAVGLVLELSPFFGVEAGALIDYTFGHELFREGFLSVSPFLGVTLYVYDEDD